MLDGLSGPACLDKAASPAASPRGKELYFQCQHPLKATWFPRPMWLQEVISGEILLSSQLTQIKEKIQRNIVVSIS